MRSFRIFLLSAAFVVTAGTALMAQPKIRPDHPRIFFNADSWKEIAARAEGPTAKYKQALLEAVDKLPDNPVASNTGPLAYTHPDVPASSVVEFGKESAMCALAWRLTGEQKYLEKTKKMLRASVDAYTEATNNLHPVNWYSHSRINALCAYDWIYEALTEDERRSFIVPLVTHVELVQPETGLTMPRNSGGDKTTGFYGMRNMLWYSGLAAYGDGFCDPLAARHLKKGYEMLCEVMDYRNTTPGDDGGISSAVPGYSLVNYPYAHFNFMFSMLSATGENIAWKYPNMRLTPNWIWWLWIRDADMPEHLRFDGWGDANHNNNYVSNSMLWGHLNEYIQFFKDVDPECAKLTAALRHFTTQKDFSSFVYPILPFIVETDWEEDPKYVDLIENSPLKARHFEALGVFHMRSAWKPDATYCTFTAGARFSQHKHFDENNFTIYKYDHLALDTGCRARQTDYNLAHYYSQSVAHNVVLIHKPGEPLPNHWGIKMTDNPQAMLNDGGMVKLTGAVVKAFETGSDFTYIASDATSCYGDKCTEAVRQFVFVYPDYFIVYDRVGAADASYAKEWLLHTKEQPKVGSGVMRADSGEGRLFCQTLLPRNAKQEVIGGPGKEYWSNGMNFPLNEEVWASYLRGAEKDGRGPYTGAWRLSVKPSKESKDDRFLNVLTATDVKHKAPVKATYVKDASRDGVVLSLGGKKMTFWFNRDGEVGGDVVINGHSRPLTDQVQKQSGVIFE